MSDNYRGFPKPLMVGKIPITENTVDMFLEREERRKKIHGDLYHPNCIMPSCVDMYNYQRSKEERKDVK